MRAEVFCQKLAERHLLARASINRRTIYYFGHGSYRFRASIGAPSSGLFSNTSAACARQLFGESRWQSSSLPGAHEAASVPWMQRRLSSVLLLLAGCIHSAASRQPPSLHAPSSSYSRAAPRALSPVASAKAFYFGHSLVDQDMPRMVGSFAKARGKALVSHGQLGWGAALKSHYDWSGSFDETAPLGFVDENQGRPFFAGEGKAQLQTGSYDVLVLAECKGGYTSSEADETVDYATRFVKLAREANPTVRVFLYGNWLDRKEFPNDDAWRATTESKIRWWEGVADRVNAKIEGPDIFVLPGGPILVRVAHEAALGKLPGLSVDDLFRGDDGVHVSDRGFYVIALMHYAAIFRETPVGLPTETETEDGPAEPLSNENAISIQQLVWDALTHYPRSGIAL